MRRTTLLGGVAAGVISMMATAAVAGPIDIENTDGTGGNAVESTGFRLASERNLSSGLDGAIEGTLTPNAGASWTTDDALLTLRVSGPAVLRGPLTVNTTLEVDPADDNCYVAASIVSTSSTEITYLLSGVNQCDDDGAGPGDSQLSFRLPITMTAHGTVRVSAELRTDSGGTLIDQQSHANTGVDAITSASAFSVAFDGAVGAGAGGDTIAELAGNPPYLNFTGDNLIGTVRVSHDPTIHRSLNDGEFVSAAQVNGISTTFTGDFTAYDGAGSVQMYNTVDVENDFDTSISANSATVPNEVSDLDDLLEVYLNPNGTDQIQVSNYSATVSVDLVAGWTDFARTGNLESVEREGANITVPIFNSATRAAASGGNYVLTIGNVGNTPTGVVQVQVLNTDCDGSGMPASCAGTFAALGQTFTLANSIAIGESLTLTSAQMQAAMGGADFGKGDLLIIIEADQDDVTLTRLLVRPDGVSEVSIGTADERLD